MIEFLRIWVIDIIIMIVFISFLEIILPNSNMKKYIQMIIGLLITIVLIKPFINFITKDINIEKEVFANIGKSYSYFQEDNNDYVAIQTEQIISIYKSQLYEEINEMILKEEIYEISNIEIDVVEDNSKENYGEIIGIKIALKDNKEDVTQDNGKISIEEIDEVVISTTGKNVSNHIKITEKCKDIQQNISSNYRIPEDKVLVYIETKN